MNTKYAIRLDIFSMTNHFWRPFFLFVWLTCLIIEKVPNLGLFRQAFRVLVVVFFVFFVFSLDDFDQRKKKQKCFKRNEHLKKKNSL